MVEEQRAIAVFDLDGTLLDRRGYARAGVKDVLQRLRREYVQLVLASGRPRAGLECVWDRLGFRTDGISLNGSLVITREGVSFVASDYLQEEALTKVVRGLLAIKDDVSAVFGYTDTAWIACGDAGAVEREARLVASLPFVQPNFKFLTKQRLLKVTAVVNHACIDAFDTLAAFVGSSASLSRSQSGYVEINACGVNKQKGLQALLPEWESCRLVVIGDGENDLPLFEIAESAIAMPNAPVMVRRAADVVLTRPAMRSLEDVLARAGLLPKNS